MTTVALCDDFAFVYYINAELTGSTPAGGRIVIAVIECGPETREERLARELREFSEKVDAMMQARAEAPRACVLNRPEVFRPRAAPPPRPAWTTSLRAFA